MKIMLDMLERLPKLREAYVEGRLGFQNSECGCYYTYSNTKNGRPVCCAIGAMLTEEERAMLIEKGANGAGITTLHDMGIVQFAHESREKYAFIDLQREHDDATNAEYANDRFEKRLNCLLRDYGLQEV